MRGLERNPERRRQIPPRTPTRSEEHTSELQSHVNLVCRLLLEKKKKEMSVCESEVASPATIREKNTQIHSTKPAFWKVARMPDTPPRRSACTQDSSMSVFRAE